MWIFPFDHGSKRRNFFYIECILKRQVMHVAWRLATLQHCTHSIDAVRLVSIFNILSDSPQPIIPDDA